MAIIQDRPNFIANGFRGPFGVGTSGSVTDKQIPFFENIFWENDPIALKRCLRIFTQENLSMLVKRLGQIYGKPFLLIHGGGDGGVPGEISAELVQKSVPGVKLTIYNDGGHGKFALFNSSLSTTNQDHMVLVFNYADCLLDEIINFVESISS
ncbi:uncharacterized protein FFB14_06227 [Fusarium fujikuroi]|nr:uncharacterized protein FFB14_06227 [Fusarium fujikuroi]